MTNHPRESERAKLIVESLLESLELCRKDGLPANAKFPAWSHTANSISLAKEWLDNSPPAPPTCSEVVERPPELCNDHYDCRDCAAYLEWRERRVQELEAQLAKHSGCSHCADSGSGGIDK